MDITEVSKVTNLSPSTLRYYEKIQLIPHVERLDNGKRNYSEEDVLLINFLHCMRNVGLSIETLQEYTKLVSKGESTIKLRKQILEVEREKLIRKQKDIETTIDLLTDKIANYESRVILTENKFRGYDFNE